MPDPPDFDGLFRDAVAFALGTKDANRPGAEPSSQLYHRVPGRFRYSSNTFGVVRQLDEFTLAILKSHRLRIGTQRNIPSEWNRESHLRRACHSVIANGLICK